MASSQQVGPGSIVELQNEPFHVVEYSHHKMGRGGAVVKLKLRSLRSGRIVQKTIQGNETLSPADISRSEAQFLYRDDEGFHFMDNESFEQFFLDVDQLRHATDYLKEGMTVVVLHNRNIPIAIDLPPKIDLRVVSAPPGIKGDTAQGGTKEVETETGLRVSTPLFITENDVIVVNTETGEYVERLQR
jgi:elongation factor P